MKKTYHILTAALLAALTLTACSDEQPFSTASATDAPVILSPIFPDRQNGNLAEFANIERDDSLQMQVTVTPADYTTVTYLIDGEQVAQGTRLAYMLPAGTYTLKIVATTTAQLSTYREGTVIVRPLEGDPYSAAEGIERIVSPGHAAVLLGTHLDQVLSLTIDAQTVPCSYDTESRQLTYTVPATLHDGQYRVLLNAADGNSYGANTITVSSLPLVTTMGVRSGAGATCTLEGINLDRVAELTIGDQRVTTFTGQQASTLSFVCPSLAPGDYSLSGKFADGTAVRFMTANGMAESTMLTVTEEQTLWQGHHYVSWEKPDGDPNKMFNALQATFGQLKAGTTVRIDYAMNAADTYHQMQVMTGWWTLLPGTTKLELSTDGTLELVLTDEQLSLINAQDGFLIGGHGIYIDRISVK